MTGLVPLLLLFVSGWLLASLWLVLIGRLLNQLSRNEPAAYVALGKPVMRWLWWRWPASAPICGPRLVLQVRGRLDLSTMYSVDALGAIARCHLDRSQSPEARGEPLHQATAATASGLRDRVCVVFARGCFAGASGFVISSGPQPNRGRFLRCTLHTSPWMSVGCAQDADLPVGAGA